MIDKTRHLHIFNLVRTFDQQFSNPCPVTAWNQLWSAPPHLQSPPPNPLSHFVCCHSSTCEGSQHACTWQPASTQARITAICWPTWWWWDLSILTRTLMRATHSANWGLEYATRCASKRRPECFHTALEIHSFWSWLANGFQRVNVNVSS